VPASEKVTFGSVEVTGAQPGQEAPVLPLFVSGMTGNHGIYSYQKTSTKKRKWSVPFNNVSTTDKNNLEDFFHDTAKGPTNPFTYTHTDGTAYANTRFAENQFSPRRDGPDQWSFTISLFIESQIG